jgi:hypothetical protein
MERRDFVPSPEEKEFKQSDYFGHQQHCGGTNQRRSRILISSGQGLIALKKVQCCWQEKVIIM